MFHINGNYSTRNNNTIETFGLNVGNKTTTSDTISIEKIEELEKSIDQSMVVEGTAKMVSSVVNEVINENIADLNQMIALSNEIDISNAKTDGDYNIKGLYQETTIDDETTIKAQQKIQNKIVNDISKKMSNKIKSVIDEAIDQQYSKTEDISEGSDIGSTLLGLGQVYGNTVADIFSAGIGNSTSKTTNTSSIENLKDTYNLDSSFDMKKNNETSEKIKNALSSKNMSKCAKDSNQSNKFKLSDIEAGGNINLENINQVASIKSVLNCAFNQEVITELATNIVNDMDENIERMQISNQKFAEENNVKSSSGDIYAAGVAGKAVLEGVGTAAIGVGEGVGTAAEGVGKGFASVWMGMIIPFIAVFFILILVYYMI